MDVDSLAQDKVWVSRRRAEPFYMAEILQCPEQALKELRLFERSSRQRAPLQSLRALMTTTSRTRSSSHFQGSETASLRRAATGGLRLTP